MSTYNNPVLVNFTPAQVAKPVAQGLALKVSAYGLARGYCKQYGIDNKEARSDVLAEIQRRFDKYAVSAGQIRQRQLVFFPRLRDIRIADGELVLAEPKQEHLRMFASAEDTKGSDLKARHASYGKVVGDCLADMYQNVETAPDDLIHVTCSGYLAPSPVERMVAQKEWFDTTVTHSYHMGCYGAFPAIKMAHGFLSSSHSGVTPLKERVDIVHTELLSGHHNIEDFGIENIITMTLFADGFIKYSVCSDAYVREHGLHGLRILAFKEHLLPDSADDMTWVPAAHQFQMTLSVMVPVVIKRHVYAFVVGLVGAIGIDFERQKDALMFAIHPGGPKIVEHIQDELGLRDEQVAISKSVFLDNGNMSSATVPHIMKGIVEEKSVLPGTRVVCLGFGPGLTVTGLVLEKI
ncbi:3-oxoacyl-[acyl-carrier-protein] synthase III C-terminal domain-containing protein [Massilia cavernae]|uniref:Type III polyketide synthase n=1 Tax=Massilia cavernae TaxID=2320864 RepID=A0A418XB52_9BURK|nr:3-oxoacyl-[acyl-carrier-protein] synthase III C-terminal domain-containing protein [Massilia cavernae]RJG09588.1 type III polyketide synthase [Massilia cavernae]